MANPYAQFNEDDDSVEVPIKVSPAESSATPANNPYSQFNNPLNFREDSAPSPFDPPKQEDKGGVFDLPLGSTKMYEGMSPEDATVLYEAYKKHPKSTRGIDGNVVYKGTVIPFPETTGLNNEGKPEAGVGIGQKALGTVRNTVRNVIGTAASVKDVLTGQDTAKEWYDKTAELVPEGLGDQLGMTAGSLFMGGVGAKSLEVATVLGKTLPEIASKLPKVLGYIVRATPEAVGGISATNPGDKGLTSMLPDMVTERLPDMPMEDDNFAEANLKNKAKLLVEATAIGLAVEKSADLLAPVAGIVKGLWNKVKPAFSETAREDHIFTQIQDKIASIPDNAIPKEIEAARDELANIIREGKDVLVPVKAGTISSPEYTRDLASSIQSGVDAQGAKESILNLPETITRARQLRKGTLESGAPELEQAMAEPSRQLRKLNEETQQSFGGDYSVQEAKRNIIEGGRKELQPSLDAVTKGVSNLTEAERKFTTNLREDPIVGEHIKRAEKSSGISIYSSKNQTEEEIVSAVRQAREKMDTELDKVYEAIPGNTIIKDEKSFNDIVSYAEEAGVLPKDISNLILEANGNFKVLHNQVIPELSKEISGLRAKGDFRQAHILQAIRENLYENQMDALIAAGNNFTAQKAKAAKDYYKNVYAPVWRDGVLEEIGNTYVDTVGRGGMKPIDFKDTSIKKINGAMTNASRERGKQIADLMVKTGNKDLVSKYFLGDVATNLKRMTNEGVDISQVDLKTLTNSLYEGSDILSHIDPEFVKKADELIAKFKSGTSDIAKRTEELSALEQAAKEAETQIMDGELGAFFKKEGLTRVEKPNAYEVFKGILNNPQSETILKRIIDKGNFAVKEGLKSAHARYMNERFFKASEGATGTPEFNPSPVKEIKDAEASATDAQVLKYGDMIFKDHPEIMEAQRLLIRDAERIAGEKTRQGINPVDIGLVAKDAQNIANTIIKITYGTLNHAANIARTVTGIGVKIVDPREDYAKISRAIFADPDQYLRIYERLKNSKQQAFTPELRQDLRLWMTGTGLFSGDQQDFEKSFLDSFSKK